MMQAYNHASLPVQHHQGNRSIAQARDMHKDAAAPAAAAAPLQEDEAACFLLSLKHNRSVTPDLTPCSTADEQKPERSSSSGSRTSSCSSKDFVASFAPGPADPNFDADTLNWPDLVGQSPLVSLKDRDLVPDALFIAMAQMRPCTLSAADRVGCYKSRELGFLGMCCTHCGGQPGFGRYYPNSVRSLAQTTTSQTVLKHVAGKCRYCPPAVKEAILELQRQQAVQEAAGKMDKVDSQGRPRYGSRKIFFQRIWSRLHDGVPVDQECDEAATTASSTSSAAQGEDEERSTATFSLDSGAAAGAGEAQAGVAVPNFASVKRKTNRFGTLPTQKNAKRAKQTHLPQLPTTME